MDANEYLLECLVRDRLRAEHVRARNAMLAGRVRRPRGAARWRTALGHALIRLGRALASEPARRTRHA
jgi:hypothetical protein